MFVKDIDCAYLLHLNIFKQFRRLKKEFKCYNRNQHDKIRVYIYYISVFTVSSSLAVLVTCFDNSPLHIMEETSHFFLFANGTKWTSFVNMSVCTKTSCVLTSVTTSKKELT